MLLVVAAALVLLGTLCAADRRRAGLGKISVGPPYFKLMFLVPMLPLVVLLGVGMHSIWRTMSGDESRAAACLAGGLAAALAASRAVDLLRACLAADGVVSVRRLVGLRGRCSTRCAGSCSAGAPLTRGQIGMYLAHSASGSSSSAPPSHRVQGRA